jgi:hypothetical protein
MSSNIIISLWKGQSGNYFCLATKSASGRWREHFFTPAEFGAIPNFINENKDCDIYFCPHGFTRKMRRKEYAVPPTVLWADLDEIDPRSLEVRPSVAIESSPGRYVGLWHMDGPINEQLNQRLTYAIGADKGG